MKHFILTIGLFVASINYGMTQNDSICNILPQKNGRIFYTGIIERSEESKINLFQNTKIWLLETFTSKQILNQSEVDNLFIMVEIYIDEPNNSGSKLKLKLSFNFRDEKLKYEITDFRVGAFEYNTFVDAENTRAVLKCYKESLINIDKAINSLTRDLDEKPNSDEW